MARSRSRRSPWRAAVDRNIVGDDEIAKLLARPIEDRIELDQSALGGDQRHVAAVRGLLGAQSRDPAAGAAERAIERLDLAHVAAGGCEPRVTRRSRRWPWRSIRLRDRPAADRRRGCAIHSGARSAPTGRRSRGNRRAGVERDDLDVAAAFRDEMQDRLVLQPEAGREHDLAGEFAAQMGDALWRATALRTAARASTL